MCLFLQERRGFLPLKKTNKVNSNSNAVLLYREFYKDKFRIGTAGDPLVDF